MKKTVAMPMECRKAPEKSEREKQNKATKNRKEREEESSDTEDGLDDENVQYSIISGKKIKKCLKKSKEDKISDLNRDNYRAFLNASM